MGETKFATEAAKTDEQLAERAVLDLEKDQKIDAELTVQYCRKALRTAEANVAETERLFVRGQANASAVLTARESLAKAEKSFEKAQAFVVEFFGVK